MIQKSYYELLGVSESATVDDIKRAYHRLAKTHHPDVTEDAARQIFQAGAGVSKTRQFKILTFAYHTLTNDELRAEYDKMLLAERSKSGSVPQVRVPTPQTFGAVPVDEDEISSADEQILSVAELVRRRNQPWRRFLHWIGLAR